jgi:replicative DNA helicase
MKALARDLRVTVLCLAQLNRTAAGGEGEDRPRMHHLRDSGSIEQDADAVVLLHATGFEGSRRMVTAAIEKQRNGPLGEAKLALHGPTMRFESLSPIDPADMPHR